MVEIWTHLVTQFVMNQTCQYICALLVAYAVTIGCIYTTAIVIYQVSRMLVIRGVNKILENTWCAA